MNLSRSLIVLVLSFSATVVFAQSSQPVGSPTVTAAKADIQHVMTSFHDAVAAHDGAAVAALVVPAGSTWFNVLTDDEYARAVSRNASAAKVRHSSLEDFTKFVSGSHAALDPQHSNVVILTDGTVASVYFDFVFLIDGKAENRGSETWQLVKTTNGWKIAALTYSSDPKRNP